MGSIALTLHILSEPHRLLSSSNYFLDISTKCCWFCSFDYWEPMERFKIQSLYKVHISKGRHKQALCIVTFPLLVQVPQSKVAHPWTKWWQLPSINRRLHRLDHKGPPPPSDGRLFHLTYHRADKSRIRVMDSGKIK